MINFCWSCAVRPGYLPAQGADDIIHMQMGECMSCGRVTMVAPAVEYHRVTFVTPLPVAGVHYTTEKEQDNVQ